MATCQAIINLPYTTGLPRDVAQMTFAFVTPDLDESTTDEVILRLQDFMNLTVGPSFRALASFISSTVDRTKCFIEVFDISDLPSGPPIRRVGFTLGPPQTPGSLPLEVALCSSFQGERIESMPQERRRGRIYLGPFNPSVISTSAADPRPAALLVSSLEASTQRLARENDGSDILWCVWSRKSDLLVEIDNGWVDNEWDTQRRRERGATARSIWSRV